MTNSELMFIVGDFVTFMNRDSAEFAARGVDAAAITVYEALGNDFEVFPSDEEFKFVGRNVVAVANDQLANLQILGQSA